MDEQKKPESPAPPGRVHHDKHGRAVWQWAVDAGRNALDSTSALLKRLEVPGLKIEEDKSPFSRDHDSAPDPAQSAQPRAQGGYDPYGGGSGKPGRPGAASRAAAPQPPAATPRTGPPPADKPTFLKRLFARR